MNEKTGLYRVYGFDDQLLYVGVSTIPLRRMLDHQSNSHWFSEVARIEVERILGRANALSAERKAISDERPKYNILGGSSLFSDASYVRFSVSKEKKKLIKSACSYFGTTMNKVAKKAWADIVAEYESKEALSRVKRIEKKREQAND